MAEDKKAETTPVPAAVIRPPEKRPDITGGRVNPIVPKSIDEALRVAKMLLVAKAIPENLTKEGGKELPHDEIISRVVSVVVAGSEVGMGAMSSMANIALINKRRVIWGQGAIALIQNSGQLEDMIVERIGPEPGNSTATGQFDNDFGIRVKLKRRGQKSYYVGEFTVGMARRAHLWMNANKKPWIEFPERQLFWRAFHVASSAGFSDCLSGLSIREVAVDEMPVPVRPPTDTKFLDGPKPPVQEPPTGDRTEPEPEPFPEEREDEREDGEP